MFEFGQGKIIRAEKMDKTGRTSLFLIGAAIFLAFTLIISAPFFFSVNAANSSTFNVILTISNAAPAVTYVYPSSGTPADGTTAILNVQFNASDSNGINDIPITNAVASINRSGTTRTSSGCTLNGSTSTTARYSCNISINYFDSPGSWTINASITDGSGSSSTNLITMFTLNNLYAMQLTLPSLTFSGSPGQYDQPATNNPQRVNNTGNSAFTYLNLTAYDLANGGSLVSVGNFTANTSDSASGHALINNTAVMLTNSALNVSNAVNVSVYLDIPSGITNGTYNSISAWVITAG